MSGVLIVGAGPGIGRSVALRFAREGLPVALVARSAGTVKHLSDEIEAAGGRSLPLTADAADEDALRAVIDEAVRTLGPPDALIYNAAVIRADRPGELPARAHLESYAVNVVGAMTAAARVGPMLAERGRGTILLTGGMPMPRAASTSLSLGKAALRALVSVLDDEYGSSGVHVATITVSGTVAPGTAWDPDEIAEHYWRLYLQPREEWEREIVL